MDNISKFTVGQNGLLHMKFAATRKCVNEHWGKANGKAPWSLWKVNTYLGRKHIPARWKSKTLAPFRPSQELMLDFALPANILDGYRIHCGASSLGMWVSTLKSPDDVRAVAEKVVSQLASARRVEQLRQTPEKNRDPILENVILFNRDALFLLSFRHAIKNGNVGVILDILSHWVLSFRGTGKMPKYADAVFHLLISLKQADPILRQAFLDNWLVNLSGRPDGFKENDLYQEHQNFWAKVRVLVYLCATDTSFHVTYR